MGKEMKDQIKIVDIPDYIYQITGKRVTKQTIYRWINRGKSLPKPYNLTIKLRTEKVLGQLYTTKEYITTFLSRISL